MKIGIPEPANHLDDAFNQLIAHIENEDTYFQQYPHQRRIRRDIPRTRDTSILPRIVETYQPLTFDIPTENKRKLLLLSAFEATYHGNLTPISPDMVPLVIDTGASISITPYKTDFTNEIKPTQSVQIKGIASGLNVMGYGPVQYSFYNDSGLLQTLHIKHCLYVPHCTTRLLCPRQLSSYTKIPSDGFFAGGTHGTLTYEGKTTTIQYDALSALPILYTASGIKSFQHFCAQHGMLTNSPDKVLPSNSSTAALSHQDQYNKTPPPLFEHQNLSPRQRQKLQLHERCAHAHWEPINSWIRAGSLPCDPSLASEPDPVCATCQFGKAHKRSHKSNAGHIAQHHTSPGEGVSSDGLEAGAPGKVMTTGGTPTLKKYRYCSFWVDHYSQFMYVTMHESKRAEELVKSKLEFKDFASRYDIKIKSIRADNGVYTAKLFQESCQKKQQSLTFCAVGAHWQNGIAERFIGSITQRARTILLHAMARWPTVITEDMWTFAIRHAVNFHNSSIRRDKNKSPYHLFTGQESPWNLSDFHVFGCPVYVLNKKLQDGDNFSKWRARSWQGVYIGHSNCHASNVPLVYNPRTTYVTPQYHLVFNESFTSIIYPSIAKTEQFLQHLYSTNNWHHKSEHAEMADMYYFDAFWMDPPLPPKPPDKGRKRKKPEQDNVTSHETTPVSEGDRSTEHTKHIPDLMNTDNSDHIDLNSIDTNTGKFPVNTNTLINTGDTPTDIQTKGDSPMHNINIGDPPQIETSNFKNSTQTLSSHKPQYNIYHGSTDFRAYKQQKGIHGHIYILQASTIPNSVTSSPEKSSDDIPHLFPHVFSAYSNLPTVFTDTTISSFLALNNKEDTLTQSQMLKSSDSSQFIQAQVSEIRGLERMHVFDYKTMDSLPPNARLLSSIWSYRRKRRPNGALLKHKARICVDGSQQLLGRDYWESYAPVVSWSTIRLVLLLATILNLKSCQVDYTQAFPQAKLNDPVFMRLPQGWYLDDTGKLQQHPDPRHHDLHHYIQLKRNLYGCKQAARNWFHFLTQGLTSLGFYQSKLDQCLYLRNDCIMVVYTDDCLIFAKDDNVINSLLDKLSSTYLLEDQGDVNDYLGIHIFKDTTKRTITMTQPGLIESIIADLNLNPNANISHTPSDSILHPDPDNTPRQDSWNYRSVIGKLNFLAQNTRPDISFSVHQCARFCTNPTALHEMAVKRIARYLLATKTKGLILHPTTNFNLDMYVYADFAGMYHREHSSQRENVLSRSGYIITFCGCPIHWASKLQTEIALSTTESEYIALSMATRELLPLRRLLEEIHQYSLVKMPLSPAFNTTKTSTLETTRIYEDNASCIVVATTDSTRLRTKHIALKWHHFKGQIKAGHIKVIKISSQENWADILTKHLTRQKHCYLRQLIMGW
jgi:hypothetical protein